MNPIRNTDPDYRICSVDIDTLVELQLEAEARGWSTRWTSVESLRSQVSDSSPILLQSFLRQTNRGGAQTIRCFALFSTTSDEPQGAMTTIDVDPSRFAELPRIDRDLDVRKALAMVFLSASGGISMISKG